MSTARHTIFAYLLLFVVLGSLVQVAFAPLFSAWKELAQRGESLQADVLSVKAKLEGAEQKYQLLESELKFLLESGEIGFALSASDAGHRLQQRIKRLLMPHSVKITQLRPSNTVASNGLSNSGLELNLSLPSESLQPLLVALSNSVPSLNIELISIRSNTKYSTQLQNELEINLSLSTWYAEGSSPIGKLVQAGRLSSVEDATTRLDSNFSEDKVAHKKGVLEQNILAGLFDLKARARFASPSPKHYRLAAINISQNARVAIIADTADGRTRRLEQGDFLDVWLVDSISSSGVNLTYLDRTEVLNLSR